MFYDFSKLKKQIEKTESWFKDEIALLRTGRVNPTLVENINVDYFGSKSPLKAVASISIEDARTLRIKPWGPDMILPIEQAVRGSGMGAQALSEKDSVRAVFPELTEERRKALLKVLREKLEEARVSLRAKREEVWRDIQDKERAGEIGEDDKFRFKDELQSLMDGAGEKLENLAAVKEKEIIG